MARNKVSVIVPIYKVENFIERCVRSLMEQTLQEVEYIFVDDATPDKSIEVLEACLAQYPERKATILKHPQNQGLPVARNTGLALATGEYVFHCDSDDYVELTMLEELYHAVQNTNADIVWCDWYLTFAENERYMKQPYFNTPMEALKAMLSGGMKYNVWNKLVRRSLYTDNGIEFPSGYGMGEDMTMMMLFAHAKNVAYIPKAYYHYIKTNTNAFSQTYSDKHLVELKHNVQRIIDYMQNVYGEALEKELNFFKLDVKFPFLIAGQYKRWEEWYPEANAYILQNKTVSARTRYIQWLASKRQYWVVGLYSWVLNNFVHR
jgi:glycosyltransferase involved in cell wall biosynthesis